MVNKQKKLPRRAEGFTFRFRLLDIFNKVLTDFSGHNLAFGEDLGLALRPLLVDDHLTVDDPAFLFDLFIATNFFSDLEKDEEILTLLLQSCIPYRMIF